MNRSVCVSVFVAIKTIQILVPSQVNIILKNSETLRVFNSALSRVTLDGDGDGDLYVEEYTEGSF